MSEDTKIVLGWQGIISLAIVAIAIVLVSGIKGCTEYNTAFVKGGYVQVNDRAATTHWEKP